MGQSTPHASHPVLNAIESLCRPLRFAAQDDFAHMERVKNLAQRVVGACESLQGLSIPPDLLSYFSELESFFSKEHEADAAAARILEVLADLEPALEPGWLEQLLARPTSVLPGIGAKRAGSLASRGLASVGDLLFHLPARYEDRRALVKVSELHVGQRATFLAEVQVVDFVGSRSRGRFQQILQAVVGDAKATVNLKWFRGGESIARTLHKGDTLLVTGDVKRYRFSKEIVHPEIEHVQSAAAAANLQAKTDARARAPEAGAGSGLAASVEARTQAKAGLERIVPVYAAPEGVNPRTLRRLVDLAVEQYADLAVGHLPAALVAEYDLPEPAAALRQLHCPPPDADVDAYQESVSPAHRRLVLEELYLLEVGLALRRARQTALPGIAMDPTLPRTLAAPAALPFTLTDAQQRAWKEIAADLGRPHPMHRLLQGDVGSGKTAVALLAAVAAVAAGRQVALMAPTELLAEQHARTLANLAGPAPDSPLALRLGLLTASRSAAVTQALKTRLASGDIDVVVGTHALVQEDVVFADLGLAIIDEQHRFGVRQRAALAAKSQGGLMPDTLVMTATPIPRTLALTLYGDLDVSVIDALPPGRTPVETLLFGETDGRRIMERIEAALGRGEQVYVVYPLVEESEKVDLRSALESTERIRAALPGVEVGVVHGRLDAAERGAVMDAFSRGRVRVLVSTTVIEVGVDVPNATLMIIEHAERFGLAQLHQLRGRVGRGGDKGTCVLVARGGSEKGDARLRAMLETTDGFEIADADLAIRGPGEFLGTRQSGHLPELRMADLLRDARFIAVAREAALETVRRDPDLAGAPGLLRAVAARWGDRLALARIG